MTTIQLLTNDQHLIAVQKVKLASGDVNSVALNVAFDSMWDRYAARTAIFYTSKDDTKYEMLLTDGKCTVPHEVLADEAALYIGVRAATTDGTAIKTSSIVQLKIKQGANAADTTIEPTMDLYQQYLAAAKNQTDPILNEMKANINKVFSENIEAIRAEIQGVVLWTNPDEKAEFLPQVIPLDLAEYERVRITFKYTSNDDAYDVYKSYAELVCTTKGIPYAATVTGKCCEGETKNDDFHCRTVTVFDTGIDVSVGKSTGTSPDHNNYCVPCKIIGYKH